MELKDQLGEKSLPWGFGEGMGGERSLPLDFEVSAHRTPRCKARQGNECRSLLRPDKSLLALHNKPP